MADVTIKNWLIYGAYGYTGHLIVAEAAKRGHLPVIAGRDEEKLLPLSDRYGLNFRAFDLSDHRKVKNHLDGIGLVLNCAGPFSHTASVMRTACLEMGVHYLDITGEIAVLQASYETHEQARRQGCVVVSGVGFDVVPTDFLAHALKEKLPSATHLELAFAGDGGISPGTAKTMLEMLANRGMVREDSKLKQVPLAFDSKPITFSDCERYCATISWGDVCTAFYSTDIPNIRVYTAIDEGQVKWMRRLDRFVGLFAMPWLQNLLKTQIARHVPGPDERQRQEGCMHIWGRASDGKESVEMRLDTPEGYTYTVISALMAVEALLAHKVLPGAYTPSQAFPPEAVFGMAGVTLHGDANEQEQELDSGETMKKQLEVMLQLQDKMNSKVHPQWIDQHFAWFRAIWIECGELVDHYGYKWWKKQVPDMQQVQLEVVDIWHFGMSMLLDGRDYAVIAAEIETHLKTGNIEVSGVIDATEDLAESILATRRFDVCKFWSLLQACDMSFDELFKQYVGKNVLNFFRQDHGYKEGTYIKQWNGREDNEYLSDILNAAQDVHEDFAEQVYRQLEKVYKTLQ